MLKTAKEHSNDSPRGFLTGIMYGGCSYLLTTLYLRMKLVNLMILIVMIYETAGYLDNNNFFWSYQVFSHLFESNPLSFSGNPVSSCSIAMGGIDELPEDDDVRRAAPNDGEPAESDGSMFIGHELRQ